MLSLSTYVGRNGDNTYWYLSAVPELMSLAAGAESFISQMGSKCVITAQATDVRRTGSTFFTEYLVAQRGQFAHGDLLPRCMMLF